MKILLDKSVCSVYPTCSRVPKRCRSNSVFLVDTSKLKSPKDVLTDDNGKWLWGGQAKTYYTASEGENDVQVHFCDPKCNDENVNQEDNIFVLKRKYYKHKTVDGNTSFRRSVTCIEHDGRELPVIILHYFYESGDEVPLVLSPHKNRMYGSQAHMQTQHSTLRELSASAKTPKETFTKFWTEKGGIIEIDSFLVMPQDQRQIYNA